MRKPSWTAAAGSFAAVAFLFGAELFLRNLAAPEREYWPILAATAVMAIAAAVLTTVLSIFLSRFAAAMLAILPSAALVAHGLLRDLLAGRPARLAATLAAAALMACLLAWPATRRLGAASLAAGALAAIIALLACGSARVSSPRPAAAGGGSPGRHPDVILLVMDTTRRDHLTLYGYPRPTSPHLAAFARRAAVYDDAWSVAPWTPSSHASMLTGLLPAWHGVDGETEPPLPTDLLTLPEVLHGAGYRTAGFTANPNLIGPGWEQGFDVYRPPWYRGLHSLIEPLNLVTSGTRDIWRGPGMSARVLRSARRWWEAAGDTGPGDPAPRFLFINLLDPHRPYAPPARDYRTFLGSTDPAVANAVDQDPVTYHLRPGLNSRQRELLTGLYDAEIAAMDREIGSFLAWLARRGDLDRCLLVVTADHGERLGERGLVGHDLVMDEFLLRVPLLVRYPPAVRAGRVERRVQLDGLPGYILDLARVPAPPAMAASALQRPGRALAVAQYQDPRWFLDRMAQRDRRFDPRPYRGDWDFVAGERYAYVWSPSRARASGRLVDMAADPGWSRDAAGEHPEVARALDAAAEKLPLFRRPEGGGPATARALDRQEVEHLRSLGYVN